jgi:hypothetical protein
MLSSIDSYELAEWQAFEQEFGTFSNTWRDIALREIHHAIMVGNANFVAINSDDDPVEPESLPMPWDMWKLMQKEQEEGDG